MKKLVFLFAVLIHIFQLNAQEEEYVYPFKFGEFSEEDKTVYVFADAVHVRKSPDATSKSIGKLTIGTKLNILEINKATYTQHGITSPWIKVKAGSVNGYVWGGTLSKNPVKLNDKEIALWGLTEIKESEELSQVYASIRIASDGIVKSKSDFQVIHGDRPHEGNIVLQSPPLLEGSPQVLIFGTPSEACGVYASQHYFLYDKTQVHFVGSGYSMGDGGVLHTSRSFVFPYPPQENEFGSYHFTPDEGHIFCVEENGSYDEDCIWTENQKVYDYTWDGTQLVKACNE